MDSKANHGGHASLQSDYDRLRFKISLGLTLVGFLAFSSAAILNHPPGLEGIHNLIVFPILATLSLIACVTLSLKPQWLGRITIAAFITYSLYMVEELILTLFFLSKFQDPRIVLFPLNPWLPIMTVFSFVVFTETRLIFYSALSYCTALFLAVLVYILENPKLDPILKNGLLQQFLFSHYLLVGLLMLFSKVRNNLLASKIEAVKLEQLALTDELTGLLNRRALTRLLGSEFSRFNRNEMPFAILMIDLDKFKTINDSYGHDQGDAVLKAFGELLRTHVRDSDWCGRWGGEEFLVILSMASLEGAEIFASRIRKNFESLKIQDLPPVTASFGISLIRKGDDIQSLVKRADEALYCAKNKGRNRVETAA